MRIMLCVGPDGGPVLSSSGGLVALRSIRLVLLFLVVSVTSPARNQPVTLPMDIICTGYTRCRL
jgi:hypothetical protein